MTTTTDTPVLLVVAIDTASALHGLTPGEREFIGCVFDMYSRCAEEACGMAGRILGFPPTGEEGLANAATLMALSAYPFPPAREELLAGIERQSRPQVILAALRDVARAGFPPGPSAHLVGIFSEQRCVR